MEKSRGDKLKETMIAKYGSEEAYKEEMKQRGAKARRDTPRGFAVMDKSVVKDISRKGHDARWKKETTE